MKKYLLTIAACVLLPLTVCAQYERPGHNFGLSFEAGFSNLFYGSKFGKTDLAQPFLGGGGGAAFFYEFEYKHFLMRTGFGVDYTLNTNRLTLPDYTARIAEYPGLVYHYDFKRFSEMTTYGVGYVPVMLGGIFNKVFFLAGAKIGVLAIDGFTQPKAKATIWATDPDVIDPMEGLYTHQLKDYSFAGSRLPMHYKPINIMASFELGLNLDKKVWEKKTTEKKKKIDKASLYRSLHRKKTFKECLHYRLSLFADFGFSDLYQATPEQNDLLRFNNVSDITPNSLFSYVPNGDGVLTNFMVGVKFAVMYEIPRKAPKKGNMAYPYIVTFVTDEVTTKPLVGAKVTTQLAKSDAKGKKKKPVTKTTDSKYGRVEKSYPPGDYLISVARTGYIPSDTLTFTHEDKYDTLHIALYPQRPLRSEVIDAKTGRPITAEVTVLDEEGKTIAKTTLDSVAKTLSTMVDDRKHFSVCASAKGYYDTCIQVTNVADVQVLQLEPKKIRRFVLKNMFFATNKTKILPSSEPALQELYKLLSDNPKIRIRIIGHTDDVGKDEYNQHLSEGRSASVKKEMVDRGIDPKRIETTGHGEKDPIVPNDSDEHRQMNRRVEIEILSGASVDSFIQNEQLNR